MITKRDCGEVLLNLMRFHSEDEWCASWLIDLEEIVYRRVFVDTKPHPVHAKIYALMREMAERSGVWWTYNHDFLTTGHYEDPEHLPIPLEEAHKRWGNP